MIFASNMLKIILYTTTTTTILILTANFHDNLVNLVSENAVADPGGGGGGGRPPIGPCNFCV